jgi:type I restriction enzyme S subunit
MEEIMRTLTNYFITKRSEISTLKMFVEFYQPETLSLIQQLRDGKYHARSIADISLRLFDGPFGSDRKIDMYQSHGIPYIRVKDVMPTGINKQDLVYISQEKNDELHRSKVFPGNILMTIAGRVGTAAVFPEELIEGNITGHIVGIELPPEMNAHYVAAFINSELGQIQVARWAHRTTRPELNLFEVGQILVPIPPLSIQNKIAEIVQEANKNQKDMLLQAARLIETMDEWAFDLLDIKIDKHDRLTHFLVKSNATLGDRWDVQYHTPSNASVRGEKWGIMADYVNAVRGTVNVTNIKDDISYYPVQGMDNDPYSTDNQIKYSNASEVNGSCLPCKKGDILIARLGPCLINKKSMLVTSNGINNYCSPEFIVVTPLDNVDPRFILWAVKSNIFLEQMLPKTTGATPSRLRLHENELLKLRVPKATRDQQILIGTELQKRRFLAHELRTKADNIIENARLQVERMILGDE